MATWFKAVHSKGTVVKIHSLEVKKKLTDRWDQYYHFVVTGERVRKKGSVKIVPVTLFRQNGRRAPGQEVMAQDVIVNPSDYPGDPYEFRRV